MCCAAAGRGALVLLKAPQGFMCAGPAGLQQGFPLPYCYCDYTAHTARWPPPPPQESRAASPLHSARRPERCPAVCAEVCGVPDTRPNPTTRSVRAVPVGGGMHAPPHRAVLRRPAAGSSTPSAQAPALGDLGLDSGRLAAVRHRLQSHRGKTCRRRWSAPAVVRHSRVWRLTCMRERDRRLLLAARPEPRPPTCGSRTLCTAPLARTRAFSNLSLGGRGAAGWGGA